VARARWRCIERSARRLVNFARIRAIVDGLKADAQETRGERGDETEREKKNREKVDNPDMPPESAIELRGCDFM